MPDYSKGKIYCIKSPNTDKVYIGSTTQQLKGRYNHHKYSKDCASKVIFEYDDVYIELIENYPCNSREELEKYEGKLQREIECVNIYIAGRKPYKWYQEVGKFHRVEEKLQYNKDYYQKNKESELLKAKNYRDNILDKDKKKEYNKEYGKNHRKQLNEYGKKKVKCPTCDKEMNQSSLSRHKKSHTETPEEKIIRLEKDAEKQRLRRAKNKR